MLVLVSSLDWVENSIKSQGMVGLFENHQKTVGNIMIFLYEVQSKPGCVKLVCTQDRQSEVVLTCKKKKSPKIHFWYLSPSIFNFSLLFYSFLKIFLFCLSGESHLAYSYGVKLVI